MDSIRPGTAPCQRRPTPEQWTQVDALVQGMLSSVASTATSSSASAPARRPHTACVCARAVPYQSASSEEDESDGGSMDEGLPEELVSPVRLRTAAASTAQVMQIEHEHEDAISVDSASSTPRPSRQSREISRETQLLYGGGVFGQALMQSRPGTANSKVSASPPEASKVQTPPSANAEALSGKARDAAAKAAAKKLPKQCLFLDFTASEQQRREALPASGNGARKGVAKRALAPGAARMRSHLSWTHYLPAPHLAPAPSAASTGSPKGAPEATASATTAGRQGYEVQEKPPVAIADTLSQAVISEEPPQVALPSSEPPKRKRVPKYSVLPGGSRPKNFSHKVKHSDLMVLEFRTEPRVVPASRLSEGRGAPHSFRPVTRDWAEERGVLSSH